MTTVQTKVPTTVTATTNEPKLTARAKEVLRVLYRGKTRNGETAKITESYKGDVYLDHIVDINITKDVSCTRLTFDALFQLVVLKQVERNNTTTYYKLSDKGKALCGQLFGGDVVAKVMTPRYLETKVREYIGGRCQTLTTNELDKLVSMLKKLDTEMPTQITRLVGKEAWFDEIEQTAWQFAYDQHCEATNA